MTRHIHHALYALAFLGSVFIGCNTYLKEREAHERAETVRAEFYVKQAEWLASAARFEAITAAAELENKRTGVETELRKLVIAEYRKCKKGRC